MLIDCSMCRCPALREIIQDFWQQGGGCLELSIDASDEVVASVCHYIHHGLLALPGLTKHQLELLRVSSELGMLGFQHSVEEAIEQLLVRDNVREIAHFSESFGFNGLVKACSNFMQTGKVANHIRLQVGTEGNPNNISLKNAIYESLHDVSELLMKPTTTATKPNPTFQSVPAMEFSVQDTHMSFAEDDFTLNNSLYDTNASYRVDSDSDQYQHHSHSLGYSNHSASKTSKPKSGGIYSLLLQGKSGSEAVEAGLKPLRNDQVPGRAMEKPKPVTGHKDAKSIAKTKHKLEESSDDLFAMPQEYNRDMSLKPSKPKSEAAKRLVKLT